MAHPIAPVQGDPAIRSAIQRASEATGVDFSLLVETARRESALDPAARARTSSAQGLFQFVDATWLDMVRKHGAQHGLGEYASALQNGSADAATRRDILALRDDPEMSALMAGELTRDNAASLSSALGRAPSAGELYAAHVLGAGGAVRLIQAAASGADNAAALFPREAAANAGIFYANGQPASAQAVLDRLNLDATAAINGSAPAARDFATQHGMMSPALAQALFTLALMPLLQDHSSDATQSDPLQALAAYTKNSVT